ncbi:hypothetical protein [Chroococcidiopsis sp. CCMEE 29]|uniref:hypothetical protein n=1 Tax=Chroococcidiopsis sp. CCMEE 29 TaxID=155894 RepID=UPI00202135B6|nr:hypothetical protein [Chroococcidiopsis sp. CCMEE 29]
MREESSCVHAEECQYVNLLPEDGVIRSRVFPGLWLDTTALLDGNMPQVLAVLQASTASAEHQAFVRKLADTRSGSS